MRPDVSTLGVLERAWTRSIAGRVRSEWLPRCRFPAIAAAMVGLVATIGAVGPAEGQAFAFRYTPLTGTRSQTIIESSGTLRLVGLPGYPDGSTGESVSAASLTKRAEADGPGRYRVAFVWDSIQAQTRVGQEAWRPLSVPRGPLGPAEFTIDSLYQMTLTSPSTDTLAWRVANGAAGWMQTTFAPEPVAIGERWIGEFFMPFTMEIPGENPSLVVATLAGPAANTLDSLVVRDLDTLAYVTIRGRFETVSFPVPYQLGGGPATAEIWGEYVGRWIWSTGWGAFVSGVTTARVQQRLEAFGDGEVPDARITSTLTTRFRIRR